MSRNTFGGGRVLGSAKRNTSLISTLSPQVKRPIVSPSASSTSLNSQASASQFSSEIQDLSSRVSLDNGETSASTALVAAGSLLVCPICNEEMITLLQLNRHLDDAHQNLEERRQDEVKVWFKAQMEKAKRFQPLAVLNQKLKGLDVFESNDNNQPSSAASSRHPMNQTAPSEPSRPDPDEVVTRDHWQPRGQYDSCFEPSCGRRLTVTNGCVNCRKCGKLFCEEHTMYQMKLSRSTQHEPVRGLWCRVCETCYKSRESYNDHNGVVRDQTETFNSMRKPMIEKALLEVSRLEKRLTRLTKLLATLPADEVQTSANQRWSIAWQNDRRRALEQSVVSWQDDGSVSSCPFCQQEFMSYTFRRHHCRTCGRVVCGDPLTGCSSEVGLTVLSNSKSALEKSSPTTVSVDIRLCRECKMTIFYRRDFEEDRMKELPDVRAYGNLMQFKKGIRFLLPKFQELSATLQDPRKPPSTAQLHEAAKVRKRLIDLFAQYDFAAKRIRGLPTDSPTQKRLQTVIYQQATNFLHLHLLPLKGLPKLLKHASSNGKLPHDSDTVNVSGAENSPAMTPAYSQKSGFAPVSHGDRDANDTTPRINSVFSEIGSAVSALEAEEKSLREQLIVLEEQKFFVSEMIADANRRRKFDEVSSLAQNIEDLSREIDQINVTLSQLDFGSIYIGNHEAPS